MIRRLAQLFSLGLFIVLLGLAASSPQPEQGLALYLGLDPLNALLVPLLDKSWVLLPGLLVALLTVIGGRWFCAWLCPLGGTLDLTDRLINPQKAASAGRKLRGFKLGFLALLAGAGFFGLSLLAYGSPLALAGRLYALVLGAFAGFAGREALSVISPLADTFNLTSLAYLQVKAPVYQGFGLIFLYLAVIIGLSRLAPRFWCRCLCPAGALLGLLSFKAVFKRRVSSACLNCGKCQKICPMGAISSDPEQTLAGECISCLACQRICPTKAVSFRPPAPGAFIPAVSRPRRIFMTGLLAGVGAALADRLDSNQLGKGSDYDNRMLSAGLLRPPGAVSEAKFLDLCIRCGVCMSSCPTNMLVPALGEGGWNALWTPIARPRQGPCQVGCVACGANCPTNALGGLPPEEKIWAKIGTAVLLKHKCIAWADNKKCVVCDEACPYGAIEFTMQPGSDTPLPVVLSHKCTGCGFCEYHCPVNLTAIRVEPIGALRPDEGSLRELGRQAGLELSLPPTETDYHNRLPPGQAPGFEELP